MLSKSSNKRKVILLAVAAVLMLLIIYRMAIVKTLDRRAECLKMNKTMELSSQAPQKIQALEIQLKKIKDIIGSSDSDPENIRQLLLEKAGEYCQKNKLILVEIPAPVNKYQNDYIIQTNTISLQGPFKKLLSMMYLLEQKLNITRVMSADFHLVREQRSRKMRLQLDIFVQNIKPVR